MNDRLTNLGCNFNRLGYLALVKSEPEEPEFCDLHRCPEPCKRCDAMDRRREESRDT